MRLPALFRNTLLICGLLLLSAPITLAQQTSKVKLPPGFSVPKDTISPDGHYGVVVPDIDHADQKAFQNRVIDLRTGKTVGTINADTGMIGVGDGTPRNHPLPSRWSRDSSILLWHVDGKWFPWALVILKIQDDRIVWQTDLMETASKEIMKRLKAAHPAQYAAAIKANKERSWKIYDGFMIGVNPIGDDGAPVVLPLKITTILESNPKGLSDFPKNADIGATLIGFIRPDGTVEFTKFHSDSKN